MRQTMGSRNAQAGFSVSDISEFCRRMQAALDKRTRAKNPEAKAEAEQEMAALIRANCKHEPAPFDRKAAQANDVREDSDGGL